VHWSIDDAWWTGSKEPLGFEGPWLSGEPVSEIDEIADALICFLGDELTEGQRYVLTMRLDSGGSTNVHFVYSRKTWPPSDL
jgi:hypothetical protein